MNELENIFTGSTADIVEKLKKKSIVIPTWETLEKAYNPNLHPVMDKAEYPDVVLPDKTIEKVTRITLDWQCLAAKRTTELCFGIPVKRIYNAKTDGEQQVANAIEMILKRNRIDSLNIERGKMLFAGCEFATLWYAVEERNTLYGFDSKLKLRCRNYSQMKATQIYPIFDDNDNLIVLSFGYKKKQGDKEVEYLDTYTDTKHIRYKRIDGAVSEEINEEITIGKIPAVYCYRLTPAWEETSNLVYETEWTLSRNSNYIRKNSKPLVALFADADVPFNQEKDENKEFKTVLQYPEGARLEYITWNQATESIKFQIETARREFFSQLQLPDVSYENMKTTPMSGEARKMMFIDAQLKVIDESGRLLETFDREINVIKAFLKIMNPKWAKDVDNLDVETEITPFSITDEKETISNLLALTGGKAILPVKEAISQLGWSSDVDATFEQLQKEQTGDSFESAE